MTTIGCGSRQNAYVAPASPFAASSAASAHAPATLPGPFYVSPYAAPSAPTIPLRAVTSARTPSVAPTLAPAAVAPATLAPTALAPAAVGRDLKVMTFNLRVATAFDALNSWEFRKGLVAERIRRADPDLLGTQEGLRGQHEYLRRELVGYTFVGAGRNDGKQGGEMCGVFFRTDRFEQLDSGHFWLSRKPEKPGSKGWGAWFPRMVTWVKLRPRDGSGPAFCWFNTHLDAFASRARTEGAKLLAARMNAIAGGMPCLLTGDFNAGQDSVPYRTLLGAASLVDAYRAANPRTIRDEGTRHDFNGHKDGERIDWILASPAFQVLSSSIDRTRGLLGYPSDHFPVTATLRVSPHAGPSLPVARIE